ncbi:enoyl-CoA hydratase/isomerase family protein [Mycolicibacterium sp.]|uniref:enoyl-CoA hydratase/isomerase family protein n=1 Tax=Mycolicibacterium sp. TaxID=2320850 RepID=UPI0025FABEC8|nr:enoyl-CoA hydratase/isomerase family protein [Mycolicibacterium sp.]
MQLDDDQVATVTFARPPNNFFDLELVTGIADACESLDHERSCRAIVLRGLGKHFCAGAKLEAGAEDLISKASVETNPLYAQAVRLADCAVPMVAAVQGAAIGGGLGVALVADFRVASPGARFAVNFAQLGMHHGFGITVTLPGVVGQQHAMDLLYTGRRVSGDEALRIGLIDKLVPEDQLLSTAYELAFSIAASAPLAVRSIRETMRGDLAAKMASATAREHAEQRVLRATADYREGVASYAERRPGRFEWR